MFKQQVVAGLAAAGFVLVGAGFSAGWAFAPPETKTEVVEVEKEVVVEKEVEVERLVGRPDADVCEESVSLFALAILDEMGVPYTDQEFDELVAVIHGACSDEYGSSYAY